VQFDRRLPSSDLQIGRRLLVHIPGSLVLTSLDLYVEAGLKPLLGLGLMHAEEKYLTAIKPIGMDVAVAPAMMITRPQAATGVRNGEIRSRKGKMRPIPPNTSVTPMKRKNGPGSALPLVIS
jgi:hypothetical protein